MSCLFFTCAFHKQYLLFKQCGRDKEVETMHNVIRHSLMSFARQSSTVQGFVAHSMAFRSSRGTGADDGFDSVSSSATSSESSQGYHLRGWRMYLLGGMWLARHPSIQFQRLGVIRETLPSHIQIFIHDVKRNACWQIAQDHFTKQGGVHLHLSLIDGYS